MNALELQKAATLTDRSVVHAGKSLWEIDQLRQEARALTASARPKQTQGRVTLISQVREVVSEAEAMAPDTKGLPDKERTRAIRGNRREERQELHRRDAVRAEQPDQHEKGNVASFPTALPIDDYSLPDITEILRRFNEEDEDEQ